jgi:hypothetical protein
VPDFQIRTAHARRITLLATSPVDTVMAIRLADGTIRCDDDSGGASNPRIETVVPAGAFPVWVGTYSQDNVANYEFNVQSSLADGSGSSNAQLSTEPPTMGDIVLAPGGSDPEARQGPAGGPLDASTVNGACRGWIPTAPQFAIRTPARRPVRIDAISNVDTTMVVREPNGDIHCDDDSGGSSNPRLTVSLQPGVTAVWIGTYSQGTNAAFQLVVTPTGRH